MLILTAYNQAGTKQYNLDLFGDESIKVTLTIDDLREVGKKNASFTKDFDLPATKNNNKFFEEIYDLQVDSTYNAYQKTNAFVTDNGVQVFSGAMYLNEILNKEGVISYRVNVYSDTVNFLDSLGEATLADLDYTDLNHSLTAANVVSSWSNTGVTLTAGGTTNDVYYPFTNVGNAVATADLTYNSSYNYVPFVKLKYIIDKIFVYAGFAYDSTFFDSDFFKKIYTDTNTDVQANDFTYQEVEAKYLNTTSQITLSSSLQTVPLSLELSDGSNLFNNATYTYTAPADNVSVGINTSVYMKGYQGDVAELYAVITIGGTTTEQLLATTTLWHYQYGLYDTPAIIPGGLSTYEIVQLQNAGDTIQLKIKATNQYDPNYPITEQTIWNYDYQPYPDNELVSTLQNFTTFYTYSDNVSIDERMSSWRKDVKLVDVFKDIMLLYNLFVEPANTRRLKIEPYPTYISGGAKYSWDDKIDVAEIKQEFVPIPSEIRFSPKHDEKDYVLSVYDAWLGGENILGSAFVYPNTDFVNIEEITLEVFSFTAPWYEAIMIATEKDLQVIPYENTPRLIYKNTAEGASMVDELAVISEQAYGTCSTIGSIDGDAQGIFFGNQFGIAPGTYDTYWHSYIQDKYTSDAVMVSAYFNLSAGDISNFSFADMIIIKNQAYRVNKIEYSIGTKEKAKVELYKVFNNKGANTNTGIWGF